MDKIFNWTSTVIGIVGGFFVAIFGQWDSILSFHRLSWEKSFSASATRKVPLRPRRGSSRSRQSPG